MGTKSVRLDESVYERVVAHKRDDETVSETIERLIGEPSLLDLYGLHEDDDAVARMREAIESTKERSRESVRDLRRSENDR